MKQSHVGNPQSSWPAQSNNSSSSESGQFFLSNCFLKFSEVDQISHRVEEGTQLITMSIVQILTLFSPESCKHLALLVKHGIKELDSRPYFKIRLACTDSCVYVMATCFTGQYQLNLSPSLMESWHTRCLEECPAHRRHSVTLVIRGSVFDSIAPICFTNRTGIPEQCRSSLCC